MRKLAIGILTAAGLAIAMPDGAQTVGVDVDVNARHHDSGWREHHAEDRVVVRERHRHCSVKIIHHHGEVKKIRRCW
jgi:hypothetical protein